MPTFIYRIDDSVNVLKRYYPNADVDLVYRAYIYAAKMHGGQVRHSGEPYLSHPIETAVILANMKMDAVTIAAGLLHDVREDSSVTYDQLEEMFGAEVAQLVEGVTKISKIHFASREEYQAENIRKMLVAMANDIRVIIIKLADRLHNIRTLNFAPKEQQGRVAKETIEIFAPLANRLGLGLIKCELEDESLRYLEPDIYEQLVAHINEIQAEHQQTVEYVKQELDKRLAEHGIVAEITSRQKHLYSIYRKMKRNNISFKEVMDVIGLRVITNSKADCYLTLGTIHSAWQHIPGTFDDYITTPKPNMYQSLHTAVIGPFARPIEIQIRTWEMHHLAEEGIAAHWRYKEGKTKDDAYDQRFFSLRHLLELHQEIQRPAEFLENLKVDLFQDEVYVFTRDGHVKCLPQGATPVDFAYSVHTEVGHTCVGAKINERIMPLRTPLKNGDIITIQTQKNHHPSKDWLNFVVTTKAKNRIKHFFRTKKREEEIQIGTEMLEKGLRRFETKVAALQKEGTLKAIADEFGLPGEEDLFAAIATHKCSVHQLLVKLFPDQQPVEQKPDELKPIEDKGRSTIKVGGETGVLTRFGNCCNPLPGDEIVGFITRGRGVTVHARNCPNIKALEFDDERKINVEWVSDGKSYPVELYVTGEIRDKLLADILSDIANNQAEVFTSNSVQQPTQIELRCIIGVQGRAHLDKVMRSVRSVRSVNNVIQMRSLR